MKTIENKKGLIKLMISPFIHLHYAYSCHPANNNPQPHNAAHKHCNIVFIYYIYHIDTRISTVLPKYEIVSVLQQVHNSITFILSPVVFNNTEPSRLINLIIFIYSLFPSILISSTYIVEGLYFMIKHIAILPPLYLQTPLQLRP